MKKRQSDMLKFIYHNQGVYFKELLELFSISKRTLYYDLQEINEEIKEYGRIEKQHHLLLYVGSHDIKNQFDFDLSQYLTIDERRHIILSKIFNNDTINLENLSKELLVSKTTLVTDIDYLKQFLNAKNIELVYDKQYRLIGEELDIRELFLSDVMNHIKIEHIDERIIKINQEAKLLLTDFSMYDLSRYLKFSQMRALKQPNALQHINFDCQHIMQLPYYTIVKKTLHIKNENELLFLTAYIASLSCARERTIQTDVYDFVERLIMIFEKLSAIRVNDKEKFKKDLCNHLQTAYYRIKFNFPVKNPTLHDIKYRYKALFNIVKKAVEDTNHNVFSNMREAELGFLTMYFGGNINTFVIKYNRVIIVCPNGTMIARLLENQLINYFPTVHIVAVVSLHELENIKERYDYIISTVPLKFYQQVVVVKPILSQQNISELSEKLIDFTILNSKSLVLDLICVIQKHALVHDVSKLTKALNHYFLNKHTTTKRRDPVLSELLTRSRIYKTNKALDWKSAIKLASKPLLKENAIQESYVEAMIKSVETYGPYIVLEDGFAMPHASGGEGVNEVCASLLALEHPVDLLGKQVRVMVVLGTIDANRHLKALSSLSTILEEEDNIKVLESGNVERIIQLIAQYDKEENE